MKKLIYLFLLIFISCDSEQDDTQTEEVNVTDTNYWLYALENDEIYSQLYYRNDNFSYRLRTDIETWVNVFVQDAKRVANLDLSYVLDNEIILRPSGEIPNSYGGWAWGICDDNRVEIGLQEYLIRTSPVNVGLYDKGRSKENFSNTIQTFYHEFGHDILNFAHTCNQKDLMFNNSSEDFPCSGELIEIPYDYEAHPVYDYNGFITARDRMFKGIEQYYKSCD